MLAADAGGAGRAREGGAGPRAAASRRSRCRRALAHVNDRSSTSLPPALVRTDQAEELGPACTRRRCSSRSRSTTRRRRPTSKQLQQQTGLAEISYRNAQQDLMQRVGEAYFNVLLAQENLRVAQAEKAAVPMQRDRAQARFDVGPRQGHRTAGDAGALRQRADEGGLGAEHARAAPGAVPGADRRAGRGPGRAARPASCRRRRSPTTCRRGSARARSRTRACWSSAGELAIASAEIGKYKLSGRPTLDLVASYTLQGPERRPVAGDLARQQPRGGDRRAAQRAAVHRRRARARSSASRSPRSARPSRSWARRSATRGCRCRTRSSR